MACCCCSPLTRRLHLLHSPWFSESRWPLHLQASLSPGENSTDLEYWGAGEARPTAEIRKKWDLMACYMISWVFLQCRQIKMLFEFHFLVPLLVFQAVILIQILSLSRLLFGPNGNIPPWTFRKSQFLLCTTMHPFYNNLFCKPCCDVTVHRSEKSTSLKQFDIPWRQRTSASTVFPASFPCHHTLCTTNVSIYANKNQRVRRKCKIRKKEECEKNILSCYLMDQTIMINEDNLKD